MSYEPSITVHGVNASYFTRKITGYLDYKDLRWWLRPSIGANPRAHAAGWNGGVPVIELPDGALIWDSTSVLCHLETRHPAPSIHPEDPVHRFLDFVLDDFCDEWFYRHAVGSRWSYDENARSGAHDIGREGAYELGAHIEASYAIVMRSMTESLPRLGVTPSNIEAWMSESLHPWWAALDAHLQAQPFLFGGRPSLADFGVFGGHAAHFVRDPLCRQWIDTRAPAVVAHTHRLMMPKGETFGPWRSDGSGDVPATLVAVLAEMGRHYLPWVARAGAPDAEGWFDVELAPGVVASIPSTAFLREARGIVLARYVAARTPAIDAVLEEAGILRWFADFVDQATSVPDPTVPPRPAQNRPYPVGPAADLVA